MGKQKHRLRVGGTAADLLEAIFNAGETLIAGMAQPSYALKYGNTASKNKYYGRSRQTTSRAKQQLLSRESIRPFKDSYQLTDQGYIDLLSIRIQCADIFEDDRMLMIIFDIPESSRAKRDRLRRLLLHSGCGPFQLSVWITRSDIVNDLHAIVDHMGLRGCVRTFYADEVLPTRS